MTGWKSDELAKIDAAEGRYAERILNGMVTPEVRSTTIKVLPLSGRS